jgi:hypothetical protein
VADTVDTETSSCAQNGGTWLPPRLCPVKWCLKVSRIHAALRSARPELPP